MPLVLADPEYADLIPGYLDARRGEVALLQAALDCKDYAAIKSTGHRMKGSGASYGFEGLTEIGTRLEDSAEVSDHPGMAKAIAELRAYLGSLEVRYQKSAA